MGNGSWDLWFRANLWDPMPVGGDGSLTCTNGYDSAFWNYFVTGHGYHPICGSLQEISGHENLPHLDDQHR